MEGIIFGKDFGAITDIEVGPDGISILLDSNEQYLE